MQHSCVKYAVQVVIAKKLCCTVYPACSARSNNIFIAVFTFVGLNLPDWEHEGAGLAAY